MLRLARYLLVPFLVGAISLGAAWAGVVAAPAPEITPEQLAERATAPQKAAAAAGTAKRAAGVQREAAAASNTATAGAASGAAEQKLTALATAPAAGQVLAGASRVSITPRPDASKGQVWAKEGCAIIGSDAPSGATHVPNFRSPWPENPSCIYMGGYGIGPMNPITSIDEYGLWVRSVAIGDGADTVVLTILDGTSYLGDYNRFCDDCGAFELARDLGAELGIDPAGFMFASTHSHTAPDFIGGWGGVPDWYMEQVTKALRTSVRNAVKKMRPATLEAGEVLTREFNGERRDTYRSAESDTLGWFRAINAANGKTIATVGAYAAHPVTVKPAGVGDADFPAVFDKTVERRFGGVGLYFMKGLGNMSPRGDKVKMGEGLANQIPAVGQGTPVNGTDVRAARAMWDQPVTNPGLTALGTPGFFDRTFSQKPAAVRIGKSDRRPCVSASPVSVNTGITAAKVGNLSLTGAPGEIFSNLGNTIEERNAGGVTLPLAQVNDGLGYVIQNFESYADGRAGAGFVGENVFEYEDAYALDQCFGDMVLETTLKVLGGL
jgi:hypothetical protein